jgi:hypothetical protein
MAIVETTDNGDLLLPAQLIGDTAPHTAFELRIAGKTLILNPLDSERPFWQRATPEERAEAFRKWANEPRPPAPAIPDEALRRENMYD